MNNYNGTEILVFVYGTLMQGQRNYPRYLAPRKPMATGTINGYRMYDIGSYPGIVRGDEQVKGEVYAISPEMRVKMDYLEGEGFLYIRTPVSVKTDGGDIIDAEVYVYNQTVEGLREIPFEEQPYGKSMEE